MADNEIDQTAFALGRLQQGVEMILQTLSQDRTAAAQYRTEIRNEMGGLRKDYNSVRADLDVVKSKVSEMEPKLATMEQRDHEQDGARSLAFSLAGALGKAAQLVIGALGGIAAVMVDRLFFHR